MVSLIKFINDKYCTAFRSSSLLRKLLAVQLGSWVCGIVVFFFRIDYTVTTTALRENKNSVKFSKKKYLTLLPQCITCYLTAYWCWKEPILASFPFLGLLHKRSPLIISPRLLFRKMIVSQLELGPPTEISLFRFKLFFRSVFWAKKLGFFSFGVYYGLQIFRFF